MKRFLLGLAFTLMFAGVAWAQYGFAPSATVTEYDSRGRMRTLKIRERTVPAPGIGTLGEFPRHYTITEIQRDRDYGREDRRDEDDYGEDDD